MSALNTTGLQFLAGGGELGTLIRAYPWESTSLGPLNTWPQSLRTALNIILHSRFPMFLWWGPELICFYNDAFQQNMGGNGRHPDALGQPAMEVWADVWPVIGPQIYQVMSGGEATWNEAQLIPVMRNGQLENAYWTYSYSPVIDESGNIAGVMAVLYDVTHLTLTRLPIEATKESTCLATDITHQKKGVLSLEESSKRLRLLADAMPQLVWIADHAGKVVYYNSRIQEYKIKNVGDAQHGYQWESMVHPDDLATTVEAWNEAVLGAAAYAVEHRILMKNGKYRWHLSRGLAVKDINGDIQEWFGTATDINTIKQAEVAIRESEALFRQLTEDAPMFVWITNTDAYMQYANRELLKYVGMEIQQLLLSNIWEKVAHPEDIAAVYAIYEQQKKHPEPFSMECRIREGATGKYNWFLFKGVPKMEKEDFQGFIGTAVNIQGFRDAEQTMREFSQLLERQVAARTHELATANNQLRQSNQELEQFAHIASHDLQEPLRKVRTFAGMITEPNERSKKLIDKIEISTARMARLIQDVLNFSKLSASKERFEEVDLEEVMKNIKTDFELLIAEKGAVIKHQPLPVIKGIPFQINQLFFNLVSNSLKFSQPACAPFITITATAATPADIADYADLSADKKYYILSFMDNGIGFKQEHVEKIFKIFQRLHSKDEYSGTGIGLALCKKIVLNHHGIIDAWAMPQQGAMFKVILPCEQDGK